MLRRTAPKPLSLIAHGLRFFAVAVLWLRMTETLLLNDRRLLEMRAGVQTHDTLAGSNVTGAQKSL